MAPGPTVPIEKKSSGFSASQATPFQSSDIMCTLILHMRISVRISTLPIRGIFLAMFPVVPRCSILIGRELQLLAARRLLESSVLDLDRTNRDHKMSQCCSCRPGGNYLNGTRYPFGEKSDHGLHGERERGKNNRGRAKSRVGWRGLGR